MEFFFRPEFLAAVLSLVALEIVLGIDNIVFISLVSAKLPKNQQQRARILGLALALISRTVLLCSLVWVMGLSKPLFCLVAHAVTGKDLILIGGGFFLLAKSTREIHDQIEGDGSEMAVRSAPSLIGALIQIMVLDMVFSLDSIITAVGMSGDIRVMLPAIAIAVLVMMAFCGAISEFIDEHPTVRMLAFSFILLIGVVLIAEGCGQQIQKGYIYSAIAFSLFVELLNIKTKTEEKLAVSVSQTVMPAMKKLHSYAQAAQDLESDVVDAIQSQLATHQKVHDDQNQESYLSSVTEHLMHPHILADLHNQYMESMGKINYVFSVNDFLAAPGQSDCLEES